MLTDTLTVPHLGGSTVGYRLGGPYDPSRPTLVMVNSFSTSAELFRPQFADAELTAAANLLAPRAVRPRQHRHLTGRLGRARMAMLAPAAVTGILPRHLDGLRESAQPRPRVLGRHRLLHPRPSTPSRSREVRTGSSRPNSWTPCSGPGSGRSRPRTPSCGSWRAVGLPQRLRSRRGQCRGRRVHPALGLAASAGAEAGRRRPAPAGSGQAQP